ncbi:MAG: phytanoyl-CoA dioxygenase family protein [Planctomycetota bacterium]|nr:phytanoyl-CoA dioxygenase family protein [Planctomycetota bacterium]
MSCPEVLAPAARAELSNRIWDLVRDAEEGRSGKHEVLLEPGAAAATATLAKPAVRKLSSLVSEGEFFREIAASPRILELVAELTGGAKSIYLYSDQVFLKPAFCGSEKPLHQDNSYFRVTPHSHGVTCWVAIDEATVENGCLNYIPGSHKLGLINHRAIPNTPHHVPDVNFPLGEEVPAPVPAGGAVFHHLLCLHSSKANHSAHPRRAWALHYVNGEAHSPHREYKKMLRVR